MAITPRSFLLNPGLIFGTALTALVLAAIVLAANFAGGSSKLSYWESVRADCAPHASDARLWSESTWEGHVHCFLDADRYTAAYAAANEGLRRFPTSESLLNLRGYSAARNGDHAVAAYDFRQGLRITGSPSGIFENNLSWTMLWQLENVEPERAARVLLQSRNYYEVSLAKGTSCERVHTGMYVEYAIAALETRQSPQGRRSPVAIDAFWRYAELWRTYRPCWERIHAGDELVVEEVLSAAVIDQEMGYLAGVHRPSRHLAWFDRAVERAGELRLTVDADFCERTVPTLDAAAACRGLLR